ncbi:MAG: hypothetical protein HC777_01705 [Hyphomonadaceae bacterium]|nr:hypothetical protein [Hyphomonadaceae bacterium]
MTYFYDLLGSAKKLLSGPSCTQSDVNRATSTAYYAMFDCLASAAADFITGPKKYPTSLRWFGLLFIDRSTTIVQKCFG